MPNLTEKQNQGNLLFLNNQLQERKELSRELDQAEVLRKEKEVEFHKRDKVLQEFPQTLETLERATIPIQEHLGIKLSEERDLYQSSEKLPA